MWKLVQYYASTVQIGDVCRQTTQLRYNNYYWYSTVSCMFFISRCHRFGVPFTSLRRQVEAVVRVGVRDAKKEVQAQACLL